MGFTSEYVAQEDVDAFKLDALVNQYQNSTALYKHHWVVDKQMNSWLIPVKQVNTSESIWIFHYKNTNIEIKLYKTADGWDLTSIAPNPFNNQEVIHSLREALDVLGDNIIYSRKKERPSKERKKEAHAKSKESTKRKVGYLDILTAIVVGVIIFYIANDTKISSLMKSDDNKTSQKVQTIQSKYNICVTEYNGIFLTNSKDFNNQTKVLSTNNKQLMACGVDKYGNLYWIDRTSDGLYKANLDGTNARKIVTLPVVASGLAIDNKRERIFSAQWNKQRKHHEIVYSDFSGNNKTILLSDRSLLRSVNSLFYDDVNDKLYVSDPTKQQIVSIDLQTKELKKVVSSKRPQGIVVDYKNQRIIWMDREDGSVYSANLDGSDKKILIPSDGEERAFGVLTLDTTHDRLIFGYLLLQSDAKNRQNNKDMIITSNLDGTQMRKMKSQNFRSFSFFNSTLIVSKRTPMQKPIAAMSTEKQYDAAKLKSCLACHGQDWSRPALGKSKIVRNMSRQNILRALKGYKKGTYGGPMKGVMKGQVSRYSDAELEMIANTISSWQYDKKGKK